MDSSFVYAAAFRLHFGRRDVGLVCALRMSAWGTPVGCLGNCHAVTETQSISNRHAAKPCGSTLGCWPRHLMMLGSSNLPGCCLVAGLPDYRSLCCSICSAGLHIWPRHAAWCVASLDCLSYTTLRPLLCPQPLLTHACLLSATPLLFFARVCRGTPQHLSQDRSRPWPRGWRPDSSLTQC